MTISQRVWSAIACAYLSLCVLFGGASAAGEVANAFLQTLAVALVVALLWARRAGLPAEARPLAWIVGLFVLVVLLSLVPLPLSTWSALPYRGEVAGELRMLGIDAASLATSLAPRASVASLLALLPPAAMFLLVAAVPPDGRRWLAGAVVALAAASISLGVFQLLGGSQSPLRFYAITNADSPVGFFANVNHQVTLVLCALPCAAALAARLVTRRSRSRRTGGRVISIASVVFLLIGIALAGSIAGYGLVFPAAFAGLLIYRRAVAGRISAAWRAGFAALLVVFLGVALAGPLNQETLSDKFSEQPTSRRVIAETTMEAVSASFPVGTGLGSFNSVYRRFQDPGAASREYVNHAHNDHLEFVLELGVAGAVLLFLFAAWWLWRSIAIWRDDFKGAATARAGSVIVGIVLLHSLVDYPIRTAGIAVLFAAACAFLAGYVQRAATGRSGPGSGGEGLRHLEAA